MKKNYLFFALFLISLIINAQTYVNIPDPNFKADLVESPYINTDGDTEISFEEAEALHGAIRIFSRSSIKDITGIEAFINLTALNIVNNELTAVDLTKNIALTELSFNNNDLTTIDLSKNINLTDLNLSINDFTELDFSKNSKLTKLNCLNNDLNKLDLSKNILLEDLDCRFNKLNELDLSKNTNLTDLSCSDNDLINLDVSLNTKLTSLTCDDNKLVNLDVSKNTLLNKIVCSDNNLRTLNIANGNNSSLSSLYTENNVLSCIQVDNVTNAESMTDWNKDVFSNYSTDCDSIEEEIINIPDDVFKSFLLADPDIDLNNDNEIQVVEAYRKTSISINGNEIDGEIENITGIEYFINLTRLTCTRTNITSINTSNLKLLTDLTCSSNKITSLNLSENILLEDLYCGGNQITDLDLSKNVTLLTLSCSSNNLTDLNLTNNIQLERLTCGSNDIKSLDLSSLSNLISFNSFYGTLTNLNVANGNNENFTNFDTRGNFYLTCITVDDIAYSNTNWSRIETTRTNFNLECPNVSLLAITKTTTGQITSNNEPINGFSHDDGITNTYFNNWIYEYAADVTLTATANDGYLFTGWDGYDATNNSLTITLDEDKTVTALFSKPTLIINALNGTVTSNPESIDGSYDFNTEVTLTAVPNEGYQFDRWQGYNEASNSLTITMDENKEVTPIFSQKLYSLTLDINNAYVELTPNSVINSYFYHGTEITITVIPDEGYQHIGWKGYEETSNSLTFIMDEDKTISNIISNLDITTFASGFTSLEGIAINSNNEVYVSEHFSGKIYNLDNNGSQTEFATSGFYANDLAFNSEDKLFICAPFFGKLFEVDDAGNLTEYVDAFGDSPYGITFYNNKMYYTTGFNATVYEVDNDKTKTDFSNGYFSTEGIAFDSKGNLYVSDKNDRKLYKVTPNGTKTVIATGSSTISFNGIAIVNDIIYFTSSNTSDDIYKIVKYDPETNALEDYVTTNLNEPKHIEIDKIGNMYITNRGNGTVIKVYDKNLIPRSSHTLKTGGNNGTISANIQPVNGTYDYGTEVILTATPDEGYIFDGWEGYSETTNMLTIIINQNKTVNAIFSKMSSASINDESFANQFIIYPNPANSFIKIETTKSSILEIKVIDFLGKEVLVSNERNINIANLPSGIYLLKIQDETNKTAIKKFIKK